MTTPLERLTAALAAQYRIERELGAGGMATVYLAEDVKHRRKVAVKVLRPELAATIGPDRFAREIEVAARLQHPHILGLLDSGEAAGFFYYVMPFVEGETLRDRLAKHGELPVPEALRLLNEIADALAVAHKSGVVHRDIKPENVLLSGRHAMVMDFGVAKAVTEASGRQQLTTAGVALGTPAYMAPEQATADPQLDGRVDIYALGVLAYEMLTGHPPFHGLTPQQTLAAHVTQAPEPVGQRRPGLAPALEAVVMRCLAKRPADRFQTADELVTVLEPLATPSGGMTPTQTRPLPATSRARRVPPWVGWAAGGALVAGGALAMTLIQRQPQVIALGKRVAVAVSPELEIHPSLSPDGKMLAYTVLNHGDFALFAQQVDGGNPVRLPTRDPGGQGYGVLSPDGTRVLFLSGGQLQVMPALGGQTRTVASDPNGPVTWGSWSPDGNRVVYSATNGIYVKPIDGDSSQAIATGTDLHSPSWSPSGESIAYVVGNTLFHLNGNLAPSEIRVVPAGGGAAVAVATGTSLNTSPVWVPGRRALLFISNRDGGRDIYEIFLKSSGAPSGPPVRLTTGLDAEWITISADGKRLAWSEYTETSNIWSLPIPSRDSISVSHATQITSGTQDIENLAVSHDGAWLYYDSDRSGNQDIWRQPLAGDGPPEQLTTDTADDFDPSVSPDGRSVAFHSLRSGNRDIFVIPSTGGRAVAVGAYPPEEMNAQWAPQGRALIWDRQFADSSLWTARERPDGTWEPAHALPVGPGGGIPRWSPDGRSILFSYEVGLAVLDLATRQIRLLDLATRCDAVSCWGLWSDDGRTIYAAQSSAGGRFTIRAIPASGGRVRVVAYANDPNTQGYRFGLAVHGGKFYFPLMNRRSDIWVADLESR